MSLFRFVPQIEQVEWSGLDSRVLQLLAERDRQLEDYLSSLTGGGGMRPATKVVAASDANDASKAGADYVCDGSDDQDTIQAANDAILAGAAGGFGSILLTEGHYAFTEAVSLSAGVALRGFGRQATEIDLGSGFGGVGAGIEMAAGCEVSDLTLFFSTNDCFAGIYNLNDFCVVRNVLIDGHTLAGFYGIYTEATPYASVIEANVFKGTGMVVRESDGCRIAHNIIDNDITGWGLTVESHAGTTSKRNTVVGNHVLGAVNDGIVINGDDNIVHGNVVDGASQVTDNTKDGITVSGLRNNVQLNTVRKGGGAKRGRYGINVLAGSTDALVTNNDLKNGGQTGSFNDAGTGTITVAGNRV